ncbi:hypothetical protein CGH73_27485, partial [Vibrio parahaemolyticus]
VSRVILFEIIVGKETLDMEVFISTIPRNSAMNLSKQSVFAVISAAFLLLFTTVASSKSVVEIKKEPDVLDLVFILD